MGMRQHLLAVDQLDRKLQGLRELSPDQKQPPRNGWIASIRKALGMSGGYLADRIGVTQSAEAQFEKGERDKTISLETLRKVAEALDAELVYAIVPRQPIRETLEKRANEVARERILPIAHSMGLESQETSASRLDSEVNELARQLVNEPRKLWR